MSFSQALSGLRAQAENIKVISNNIANSQTVGFKTGNMLFADVFAGAGQVGLGVNVVGVQQDFRSGDLENTGRNLDLAIAGQGFYRLEKANGEVVYSRNGEFNQDQNGYLVNGTGQFLTGYGLSDPNDPFSEVIPGGAPQRLQIPPDDIPANATTEASAIYNLDASTVVGENTKTATVLTEFGNPDSEANVSFHFSSSFTAYDSLGNERTITSYYEKIGVNEWQASIAIDGVIENFVPGVGGVQAPLQDAAGNPIYPTQAVDGDGNLDFDDGGNPIFETDGENNIVFQGIEPEVWPLQDEDGNEVLLQQREGPQQIVIDDPDNPGTDIFVPNLEGGNATPEFTGVNPGPIVDVDGAVLYPRWVDIDGDPVTAPVDLGNPDNFDDNGNPNIDGFVDAEPAYWPLKNSEGDEVWVQQTVGPQTDINGNPIFVGTNADGTVGDPNTAGDPYPTFLTQTAGDPGDNAFALNFNENGGLLQNENGDVIGVSQDGDDEDSAVIAVPAANLDGADALNIDLVLGGTTQFNNNSVQNTLDQNGYTSGSLIGIEVENDGTVTRIYTNEERRTAGQIVLTDFINPEGLQPDGDNAWRQTNGSGEPVLGVAGTGTFGTIEGGVLENSNVDLAQQLVDMIVSQRAYQANSSSIGTQDEMLQTVINL